MMREEARRRHSHAVCARRGPLQRTAASQRGKAILRARARHERTARRQRRRCASTHACSERASTRLDHAAVAMYSSSVFSSSAAKATQVRKARARPIRRHASSARLGRARMATVCRQRTSASAQALPIHLCTPSRRRRIRCDQRRAPSLHMAVAPNRAPIDTRRSSSRVRSARVHTAHQALTARRDSWSRMAIAPRFISARHLA